MSSIQKYIRVTAVSYYLTAENIVIFSSWQGENSPYVNSFSISLKLFFRWLAPFLLQSFILGLGGLEPNDDPRQVGSDQRGSRGGFNSYVG